MSRKKSDLNDLDLSRWRENDDLVTESLWLIPERDRSGAQGFRCVPVGSQPIVEVLHTANDMLPAALEAEASVDLLHHAIIIAHAGGDGAQVEPRECDIEQQQLGGSGARGA